MATFLLKLRNRLRAWFRRPIPVLDGRTGNVHIHAIERGGRLVIAFCQDDVARQTQRSFHVDVAIDQAERVGNFIVAMCANRRNREKQAQRELAQRGSAPIH